MRRTIPLWITAACGFVLIVAHFSPYTESWGEATMIWFDILASVAFILGGGNLLKIHLKKISDHAAGWAYSAITLLAFVVTLYVGLVKLGAPPAQQQECYGEAFARLPLADFPVTYSVEGTIPEKSFEEQFPYESLVANFNDEAIVVPRLDKRAANLIELDLSSLGKTLAELEEEYFTEPELKSGEEP